jgi:hypothetical protein
LAGNVAAVEIWMPDNRRGGMLPGRCPCPGSRCELVIYDPAKTSPRRGVAAMTMSKRVKHLEISTLRRLLTAKKRCNNYTDEDWLELFGEWGRAGAFAAEPDIPVALTFYRDALAQAKAQADPPFDPPADFMPNLADLPEVRLLNWRTSWRFPDVDAGWWWLSEMHDRVISGRPAVTEAEFVELADWFAANEKRFYQLSLPSQLLDLGGGRKSSLANLRWRLAGGPRAKDGGEVAEDMRRLRTLYGEER